MSENNRELATFGGGCFWCLEAVFEQVAGVHSVVSGYSGGHIEHPDYRAVCEGTTGHVEVVRVTFDPGKISYEGLLEIFFVIHDPTTPNRQGNDVGTQYRSAIFYHSAQQQATANAMISRLQDEKVWRDPVVTEVLPEAPFFAAEDYHQHYFSRNPGQGYCQLVVAPKLAKFRKNFSARLRKNA
jgi:peptide-methionine (S)-S-oxide reductase